MAITALTYESVSIADLQQRLGTTRQGTYLSQVAIVLREYGCPVDHRSTTPRIATLRQALQRGQLVIATVLPPGGPHAVVVRSVESDDTYTLYDPSLKSLFRDVPPLGQDYLLISPPPLSRRTRRHVLT
jgi:hypothetical protein